MAKITSPWGSITRYAARDGSIRYRLRGTTEGVEKSCGVFATIEEARSEARTYAEALAEATSTSMTVRGWGVKWLEKLELEGVRTARDKAKVWGRYVEPSFLADMPVRRVRPEHVRRWLDDLAQRRTAKGDGLGDQTMRNALYCLSAGLRDAQRAGRASQNPCRGVSVRARGRKTDEWTYLTLAEVDHLLSHPVLPLRERVIYGVAIYTGLREGELWGLRWSDVVLKGDSPHITVRRSYAKPTKSGKPRTVPLFPPAVALLTAWRDAQRADRIAQPKRKRNAQPPIGGLVWPSRFGDMHTDGYDAQWATRWRAATGTRHAVHLHSMRHTFASHLIMGSWGRVWRLEEVQHLLGHASKTTTERYAHLAPDAVRGAAHEAVRLWTGPR